MENLSLEQLQRSIDLHLLFLQGDQINGVRMDQGLLHEVCIENMLFPIMEDSDFYSAQHSLFKNVIFQDTDFHIVNFSNSQFENCLFYKCSFVKADLVSTKFKNTVFHQCKFFRSNFVQTTITNCLFIDCDLSRMTLTESELSASVFSGETDLLLTKDNKEENVIWNLTKPVTQRV